MADAKRDIKPNEFYINEISYIFSQTITFRGRPWRELACGRAQADAHFTSLPACTLCGIPGLFSAWVGRALIKCVWLSVGLRALTKCVCGYQSGFGHWSSVCVAISWAAVMVDGAALVTTTGLISAQLVIYIFWSTLVRSGGVYHLYIPEAHWWVRGPVWWYVLI